MILSPSRNYSPLDQSVVASIAARHFTVSKEPSDTKEKHFQIINIEGFVRTLTPSAAPSPPQKPGSFRSVTPARTATSTPARTNSATAARTTSTTAGTNSVTAARTTSTTAGTNSVTAGRTVSSKNGRPKLPVKPSDLVARLHIVSPSKTLSADGTTAPDNKRVPPPVPPKPKVLIADNGANIKHGGGYRPEVPPKPLHWKATTTAITSATSHATTPTNEGEATPTPTSEKESGLRRGRLVSGKRPTGIVRLRSKDSHHQHSRACGGHAAYDSSPVARPTPRGPGSISEPVEAQEKSLPDTPPAAQSSPRLSQEACDVVGVPGSRPTSGTSTLSADSNTSDGSTLDGSANEVWRRSTSGFNRTRPLSRSMVCISSTITPAATQRCGSDSDLNVQKPAPSSMDMPCPSSVQTLTKSVLNPAQAAYFREWKRLVGKKGEVPHGRPVALSSLFRVNSLPLDRFLFVILVHLVLEQEECDGRPLSLRHSHVDDGKVVLNYGEADVFGNGCPEIIGQEMDIPTSEAATAKVDVAQMDMAQTLWPLAVDFLSSIGVDIVTKLYRHLCPHGTCQTGPFAVLLFGEVLQKMTPEERATAVGDVVQLAVRPENVNDATDIHQLRRLLTLCLDPNSEERSKNVVQEVLRVTRPRGTVAKLNGSRSLIQFLSRSQVPTVRDAISSPKTAWRQIRDLFLI